MCWLVCSRAEEKILVCSCIWRPEGILSLSFACWAARKQDAGISLRGTTQPWNDIPCRCCLEATFVLLFVSDPSELGEQSLSAVHHIPGCILCRWNCIQSLTFRFCGFICESKVPVCNWRPECDPSGRRCVILANLAPFSEIISDVFQTTLYSRVFASSGFTTGWKLSLMSSCSLKLHKLYFEVCQIRLQHWSWFCHRVSWHVHVLMQEKHFTNWKEELFCHKNKNKNKKQKTKKTNKTNFSTFSSERRFTAWQVLTPNQLCWQAKPGPGWQHLGGTRVLNHSWTIAHHIRGQFRWNTRGTPRAARCDNHAAP